MATHFSPASDPTPLRLIALGGLGEFGLNALVVEWGSECLLVDAGALFATAELPGVDSVVPDFRYLAERREHVRGIVLTHGHEDHIGALPYVLPLLNVPLYGTPLTYRADIFNPFNRTDFGGINGIVGNPNFGRPTGAQLGPRNITMGLRAEF